MTTLQYIHFSIELWGAFFCLISTISIGINKNFDKKGSYKLIAIMLNSVGLMVSDALAWLFRGNITDAGYYVVRIANFAAFFFGFLMMPLVAEYITHIIKKRSGISGLYWKYIEWVLFGIGAVMLIVNAFTPFIYSFDATNTYYRLTLGMLPGLLAFIGIVITLGVVFEYLHYLQPFEKISTIIYLVLPVIAVIVQSVKYGISFTYLSLVISALMLFISFEVDYTRYNTEKERKLAEDRIRLFNQQIKPHFLFNSLSVIKYLCRKSPAEAADAVDEFAAYMRASTDLMNAEDCVSIERELDLVKHYTSMQKRRFGDSIRYAFDIEDVQFKIPPFAVQTMVENAIEHGLRNSGIENGVIGVKTYRKGSAHYVEISDNGNGFNTKLLEDENSREHIGIKNTQARLQLMCSGTLKLKSSEGEGTTVTIIVYEE